MIIYIWLYVCVCVCVWKWGLVQAESIWKGRKWWQSVEFWGTLFSDKPRVLVWFERMMVVRIYVLKKEITPRVIPNWIVIPPWWMIVSTGWSIFPIHEQYLFEKKLAGQKRCFLWTIMTCTFETLVHGIIWPKCGWPIYYIPGSSKWLFWA